MSFDATFVDFLKTRGILRHLSIVLLIGSLLSLGSWIFVFRKLESYVFYLALGIAGIWLTCTASLAGSMQQLGGQVSSEFVEVSAKGGVHIILLSIVGALIFGFLAIFDKEKREALRVQNESRYRHLLLSRICLSLTILAFIFPVLSSYSGASLLWMIRFGEREEYFIVMLFYGTIVCGLSWLSFLSNDKRSIVIYPIVAMIIYLCGLIDSWSSNTFSFDFGLIVVVGFFVVGLVLSIKAYGESDIRITKEG